MFKKPLLPVLIIIALLGAITLPYQGHALTEWERITQDLNRVKQEQARAAEAAKAAERKLNGIKDQKNTALKDLNVIQAEIDKNFVELNRLELEIADLEGKLADAADELEAAEQRVEDRDGLLRNRLRMMYTSGEVTYIEVILASTSFTDFLDRLFFMNSIANQDKDILEQNKKDKDLITLKKQEIEANFAVAKDLHEQAAMIRQDLLEQQKNKEVQIASLDQQAEEEEHINAEQEKQLMALAAKESELLAKRETISYYSGGALLFPLPPTVPLRITSYFGTRVDPITGAQQAYHSGMDYAAPKGTDILAAEGGVVIISQWYGTYGECVIIDHGGGLWTVYGHQSKRIVEKGDKVKRGQKIGEVGTTGRSTGNHLHFEVRKDGTATDPNPYLK